MRISCGGRGIVRPRFTQVRWSTRPMNLWGCNTIIRLALCPSSCTYSHTICGHADLQEEGITQAAEMPFPICLIAYITTVVYTYNGSGTDKRSNVVESEPALLLRGCSAVEIPGLFLHTCRKDRNPAAVGVSRKYDHGTKANNANGND